MEENLQKKPEEVKIPQPELKPGGAGFTIQPVSSLSSKPTTPLPKVPEPPIYVEPLPEIVAERKMDKYSIFLLLAVIFNILTLLMLIVIGMDKVPSFFYSHRREDTSLPQETLIASNAEMPKEVYPSDVKWRLDLNNTEIPNVPATGMIHGRNFAPEKAVLKDDILHIRQGKEFFADLEVKIFLFLKEGEKIEGKTYNISPKDESGVPHIHIKWKIKEKMLPETEIFGRNYSMRLEFGGEASNNKLPAKIYLCLPDDLKSFVAGSFDIELE